MLPDDKKTKKGMDWTELSRSDCATPEGTPHQNTVKPTAPTQHRQARGDAPPKQNPKGCHDTAHDGHHTGHSQSHPRVGGIVSIKIANSASHHGDTRECHQIQISQNHAQQLQLVGVDGQNISMVRTVSWDRVVSRRNRAMHVAGYPTETAFQLPRHRS